MTFSGCDTSRRLTAVHFQSVERRVQRNLEGLANVRLDELTVVRRHWLFFFFIMLTRRRRGLGERGDKILRWRPSNCTHYDACRKETAWVFPETLRSASRKTERPFQAQSVSHRTDETSLESKRTPRDFPGRLFLHPLPSAAAQTAPNGVKERASFCLVFRSLNTTSSHRRNVSMGYRRAKSTQGNTNFQKWIFLANHFGISTRGALMEFRRAKFTQRNKNRQKNIFVGDRLRGHHPRALRCPATLLYGREPP